MKVNEIDFDQVVLEKYKNSSFENLVIESLNKYKQVFLLVYDKYNLRFKKVYEKDFSVFFYYLKFLELFSKDAENLDKYINDLTLKGSKKTKSLKGLDNYFERKRSEIRKAKVFLVEDEAEFSNNIKAEKKVIDEKRLYVGLVKKKIFELIDHLIFIEVDYFISTAEHKKYIFEPFKKNYPIYNTGFLIYTDLINNPSNSTRRKEVITAWKQVKPDTDTASGGHSDQQMFRRFISANKKLKQSETKINETILKNLRELK